MAKLTAQQQEEIARRYSEGKDKGLTYKMLAKEYGVHLDTIMYHCKKNGVTPSQKSRKVRIASEKAQEEIINKQADEIKKMNEDALKTTRALAQAVKMKMNDMFEKAQQKDMYSASELRAMVNAHTSLVESMRLQTGQNTSKNENENTHVIKGKSDLAKAIEEARREFK